MTTKEVKDEKVIKEAERMIPPETPPHSEGHSMQKGLSPMY